MGLIKMIEVVDSEVERGVFEKIDAVGEKRNRSNFPGNKELDEKIRGVCQSDAGDDPTQ